MLKGERLHLALLHLKPPSLIRRQRSGVLGQPRQHARMGIDPGDLEPRPGHVAATRRNMTPNRMPPNSSRIDCVATEYDAPKIVLIRGPLYT